MGLLSRFPTSSRRKRNRWRVYVGGVVGLDPRRKAQGGKRRSCGHDKVAFNIERSSLSLMNQKT